MLLAVIVALVSIVLPVCKMIGLAVEATAAGGGTGSWFYRHAVPYLSKWSMMDVLLVAIVIAAAKTTGLADAFTQPGLWCYAASTIISGLLHSLKGMRPARNEFGAKRRLVTVLLDTRRAQAGQAVTADRRLPGQELFYGKRVTLTRFFQAQQATAHSRDNLSLAADNPAPCIRRR
jgi:hypothetical protein